MKILLLIISGTMLLTGCERQTVPQITGEVMLPIYMPTPEYISSTEDIKKTAQELGVPAEWIPPREKEHSWLAIIIHHSATERGNEAYFGKEHSERVDDFGEHWIGIGYDFVIGNGTMSKDGEVETTFRWKQQLIGAHCKTSDNWANTYGVGIVLVGNFDESKPTVKQLESLQKLVNYIQQRYHIPTNDIYGHGQTPGGHATDCPGRNFNIDEFRNMLPNPDELESYNEMISDSNY